MIQATESHDAATCDFCRKGRREFCASLREFLAMPDGPARTEKWKALRSQYIPTAANAVELRDSRGRSYYGLGMTLWGAVCKSSGITDERGGRFHADGDTPSSDDVIVALLYAEVSR